MPGQAGRPDRRATTLPAVDEAEGVDPRLLQARVADPGAEGGLTRRVEDAR
jgi:hypothetical protein